MLSTLVAAGIEGGYLVTPRGSGQLRRTGQAGDRPLPAQRVTVGCVSAVTASQVTADLRKVREALGDSG